MVAGLLLGVEIVVGMALWLAGADLEGGFVAGLKLICVWFAICAGSKRLHDMNLRAWWMLGTLAITTLWTLILVVALFVTIGETALEPGTKWYMLALAGSATPILAATLWLHFRKGAPGINRFGAAPSGIGFAGPEINFQPVADAYHLTAQRLSGLMQRTAVPQAA
jgi:uncharacterized membrane protein YhaH (DUF805 family)